MFRAPFRSGRPARDPATSVRRTWTGRATAVRIVPVVPLLLGALVLVGGAGSPVLADSAYLLRVVADDTSPAPAQIRLNTLAGAPVDGWSFGVCTLTATAITASVRRVLATAEVCLSGTGTEPQLTQGRAMSAARERGGLSP